MNKENHKRDGLNPILISINFGYFIPSFFSVCNDKFEKLYQTLGSVLTTWKSVKKLGCVSFVQPTFRCWDILMKRSSSCLIYYFTLFKPIS